MKRVLKWSIPVDDQPHTIGGGPVLRAECQSAPDAVQLWTVEDALNVHEDGQPCLCGGREVQVVGTGQQFPSTWFPIATALAAGGALVWHVIENGQPS